MYVLQERGSKLQGVAGELRGQDTKIYIIDTFPYNGELVTELRLKHLYGVVDEIMVVESRTTFSGKRKEFLYTDRDRKVFDPYMDKVCCSSILLQARDGYRACLECSACMLTCFNKMLRSRPLQTHQLTLHASQTWQYHTKLLA